MTSEKISGARVLELINMFDVLLCDCDGVLWEGNHLFPGVNETIDYLRSIGKRLIFVTNNSTKSREQYLEKFFSLGLTAKKDDVFSSSFAAASYFNSIEFNKEKKIYVVGEQGIAKELEAAGYKWVGAENDKEPCSIADAANIKIDPDIAAVVVGLDGNINYKKCATAQGCLLENAGCLFIATNEDSTLPMKRLLPGAGTMVSMIKTCTGRVPTVLGKPNPMLLDIIVKEYSLDRNRILMIGDRLDTDIAFGANGGIKTLLVLTGVSTEEEAKTFSTPPTYIVKSFATLCPNSKASS